MRNRRFTTTAEVDAMTVTGMLTKADTVRIHSTKMYIFTPTTTINDKHTTVHTYEMAKTMVRVER
jgi:hypothetical protein